MHLRAYILLAALFAIAVSCKRSAADQYQRYLESKSDSTFEYVPEVVDSLIEEVDQSEDLGADDDGLFAIPDIPQERAINMSADDYETKKMMSGRE